LSHGLAVIGDCAFQSSGLASVTIPGSVTNIGAWVFFDCSHLASIFFGGNAPAIGSSDYSPAPPTLYYLPGTTGWAGFSSTAGAPLVLWNPLIQSTDANFGVRTNTFGFNITGTANIPMVIEATTKLTGTAWSSLCTLWLTNGLVHFTDPQWTNFPGRSYRIRSP
jgi:hypothetical protein